MNRKKIKVKMMFLLLSSFLFNLPTYVSAVEATEVVLEFVEEFSNLADENQKVAYLTFDDGPSIYTEALLDVLEEHDVSGIFFVLGKQFEYISETDRLLNRMIEEGHYIGLHTMTHDKNALYFSEKSPNVFRQEMLQLKDEIQVRTGYETLLCRAPYGKRGHFKLAHHKVVEDAGLYCVDWHIDSKDWAKQHAGQIYDEVHAQLQAIGDQQEIVLLFHEYQRTVDAMPAIITLLQEEGYEIRPYVDGKVFDGLE